MIKISNLSKKYVSKKEEIFALDNINLEFPNSGLYVIKGKSGSGKSTLLNIISGIDLKFDGDVVICNKNLKSFTKKELQVYRSNSIGYIFQNFNLIGELNVYENIKISTDLSSTEESNISVVLKKVGLEGFENRRINELSGGEIQRVAIARCLVKNPKIIVADEPTGSLDSENARNIYSILKEISKDVLVIIASHDDELSKEFALDIISLEKGKLVSNHISNKDEMDNEILSFNKSNISNNIILKIGKSILFDKKIGLFFSLLFLIVSFTFLSISISCVSYSKSDSFYNYMNDNFENFSIRRMNLSKQFTSGKIFRDSDILNIKNKLDDNFIYGYDISSISKNSNSSFDDYFNESNKYLFGEGPAYNYAETKDFFGLNIICGNEPSEENTCVITDLIADYFVLNNYRNDEFKRVINEYSDLIGLDLFGYKICGIVNTTNSNKMIEYENRGFVHPSKSNINDHKDDLIYNDCVYSLFTYDDLFENATIDYKYSLTDIRGDFSRVENNKITDISNINKSNVKYVETYNENSNGAIVNIDFICNDMFKNSYEEEINYRLIDIRYYNEGISNEEAINMAKIEIDNDIFEQLNKSNIIDFKAYSNLDDNLSFNDSNIVIGVNYDLDDEIMVYTDMSKFNYYESIISDGNNVEVMIHKLDGTKKCEKLFKEYIKEGSIDDYYISSIVLINFDESASTFNLIKKVSLSLFVVFACLSLFILFKYINDSVNNRIKEIGILKSLGVKKIDVIKIFSIQNIFMSVIILLFVLPAQHIGIHILNRITSSEYREYVESYFVNYVNYLAIFVFAIMIPFIASIIPINNAYRKNPKDVLNEI